MQNTPRSIKGLAHGGRIIPAGMSELCPNHNGIGCVRAQYVEHAEHYPRLSTSMIPLVPRAAAMISNRRSYMEVWVISFPL